MSWRTCCRGFTWWSLGLVVVVCVESTALAEMMGDFNNDGMLDAADLDLQGQCGNGPEFDLNGDGFENFEDRLVWVHDLKNTWLGDANLNGEFNSGDFVQVFAAGKYETDEDAGWEEGDWNGDVMFGSSDMVAAFVDGGYEKGPRLVGDYNRNGQLDAGDLDLQAIEIVGGESPSAYDLNGDDRVDFTDRQVWVNDLKNTWMGDANLDGEFNTTDLIQVFAGGKYETDETATWREGDFNGDMRSTSSDMVAAFPQGWPPGPRPVGPAATVPEPDAGALLTMGLILAFSTARRRTLSGAPIP